MIIVQTHWSKPSRWQNQNKRLRDQLMMYGLSAHTSRQAFGVPVAMVTDSAFAFILEDLPQIYDVVTTELDELATIDPRFWAFPKFHVFKKYAHNNPWLLQIDTDVFFWDTMTIGAHVDLLVQSVEDKGIYTHTYEMPVPFVNQSINQLGINIPYWNPQLKSAYNCGVVGFKDGNLAKEYSIHAINICEAVKPNLDLFDIKIPDGKRNGSIMVVPEQFYLKCFAEGKKLHVSHVASKITNDGTIASFHPFDYYHMMGDKTDPVMRGMVEDKVREKMPKFYDALAKSVYSGF